MKTAAAIGCSAKSARHPCVDAGHFGVLQAIFVDGFVDGSL